MSNYTFHGKYKLESYMYKGTKLCNVNAALIYSLAVPRVRALNGPSKKR